jgi:DNA-binding LacI/PurR family transcriptional regulator/ABC-type glycerol-3-phosphate transport system substrate-binding protein
MVTIKDIARMAGVSPATVSNVINNKGNVSLQNRRKVEAILREVGFQPNIHARALKAHTTKSFGLVLPSLEDPYYSQIVHGFDDFLKNQGSTFRLFLTQDIPMNESKAIQEAYQNQMGGLAIMPALPENVAYSKYREKHQIPWVFLDRVPPVSSEYVLIADYRALAVFTASLLREERVQHILLLTADKRFFCERTFCDVFFQEIGSLQPYITHVEIETSWSMAFKNAFSVLQEWPEISHVVATNHIHARAVLDVADYLGLSLKVIYLGRENWKAFKENRQNIIEISRPGLKIGRRAAEILTKAVEGFSGIRPTQEVVPVYLKKSPHQPKSPRVIRTSKRPVIRVTMLNDPCHEAIRSLIHDYKTRSQATIEIVPLSYEALYHEVVRNPESPFDVFMVDVSWLPECVYFRRLRELTPLIVPASEPFYGFIPGVLENYALLNGCYFAVPFYFGVQLLFYRRDIFEDPELNQAFLEQSGRELSIPRGWDEYNQVARFFTKSINPLSPVEYGTTVGAHNNTAIVCEFLPRLWYYGGEIFDREGRATIASLQAINALQNYIETFRYAPSPNNWWQKQVENFAQGLSAMMIMFTSNVFPILEKRLSKVYDRFGIAQISGEVSVLGGWSLGINARSEQVEESFEFIRWACSSELAIPFSLLGGCTPHFSVYQSAELVRALPWASLAEKTFNKAKKRAAIPHLGLEVVEQKQLEQIIGENLRKAIEGSITPKEALHKSQEEIDRFGFHFM